MYTHEFRRILAGERKGSHPLRDDVIKCFSCSEIKVGDSVFLTASARDGGDMRFIRTSPVEQVIKINDSTTEIHTESGSIYQIKEIYELLQVF